MTVSTALPQGISVGELKRFGLVLHPREVVALVHALCDQGLCTLAIDALWITDSGELRVHEVDGAATAASFLPRMAVLIESLLPPFSEERHYAPPASLHMLPARLRGAASPGIESTSELLSAIAHYETDAPARVLQHLAARAIAAAAADSSARDPAPPAHAEAESTVVLGAPLEGEDVSVEYPSGRTAGPHVSASRSERRPAGHIIQPAAEAVATGAPRSRSRAFLFAALCVAISLALSAYGGYRLVRHFAGSDGQETVAGAIGQRPPGSGGPSGPFTLPPSVDGTVTALTESPAAPDSPTPPGGGSLESTLTAAGRGDHDDQARDGPSRSLNLPMSDGTFSPSFNAAGTAVFFHAGRQRGGRLLEADLDDQGTPLQIVTVLKDSASNHHPRVSPDGRLLAFDSDRDGERGVYVADRDGTNARRVSGQGFAALPSWSPDMKWLAFVRAEPDRPRVWNLWLRDMESAELTRLTFYHVGQTWAASWLPDAHRLCYSHEDQLVLLDLVTGTTDVFPSPRAGRLVRTPAVSPDGQRIIFQVFRDGAWMVDLETRAMRKVLDDATAEEFAWHPLGRRVAYHSRKGGGWRIWVTAPSW